MFRTADIGQCIVMFDGCVEERVDVGPVVWSSCDDLQDLHGDILAVWKPWTTALTGGPIDSGHHVAEEAPEELAGRIQVALSA